MSRALFLRNINVQDMVFFKKAYSLNYSEPRRRKDREERKILR